MPCFRTTPWANFETSVVTVTGYLGSSPRRAGVEVSNSLRESNELCVSSFQWKGTFFLRTVKGFLFFCKILDESSLEVYQAQERVHLTFAFGIFPGLYCRDLIRADK